MMSIEVRSRRESSIIVESVEILSGRRKATVRIGELEVLVYADGEWQLEDALNALERAAEALMEPDVQQLGKVKMIVKSSLLYGLRKESPVSGYVADSGKRTFKVADGEEAEMAHTIVHELLHIRHPEWREWEVERAVKARLGDRTYGEKILKEHAIAVELKRDSSPPFSVFEEVYVIPLKELRRLARKRRGKLYPAITDRGITIYLTEKDRNRFWGIGLAQLREYFSPTEWEALMQRVERAFHVRDRALQNRSITSFL